MAEHAVTLAYGAETFRFGWRDGVPARDFGAQLAAAVKSVTGLGSLQGLELFIESPGGGGGGGPLAERLRVTPRDLFEGRCGRGSALAEAVPPVVRIAPAEGQASQPPAPPSAVQRASLAAAAAPPRAGGAAASAPPRFQKKGGSQFQFMRIMQMDKDPAGLRGASNRRKIPLSEVREHSSTGDVWMALAGRVFNVSPYMDYHPGGKAELMRAAGADGTALFNEIHPWVSVDMIEKLQVGLLDTSAQPRATASSSPSSAALHPTEWRSFPLVQRRQVTPDTLLLRFDIGDSKESGLRPGQHLNVRVKVQRGQELVEVQRQYTPISAVEDRGVLDLLVKVYPSGRMGPVLAGLRPKDSNGHAARDAAKGGGDSLEMQGPFGSLVYLGSGRFSMGAPGTAGHREGTVGHVVMLAAGSGVTPMLQLLRPLMLEWRRGPGSGPWVTLVFGNRREEDIIFRQELERLASAAPAAGGGGGRFRLRLLLSDPPEGWATSAADRAPPGVIRAEGRICDRALAEAVSLPEEQQAALTSRLALVCGPEGFNVAATDGLRRLGLQSEQIHIF